MSSADHPTTARRRPPVSRTGAVVDYGDSALMAQFECADDVLACALALKRATAPGIVDIVPAARTVLVTLDGPEYREDIRAFLRALSASDTQPGDGSADRGDGSVDPISDVVIDVRYDGPDLGVVADLTCLTPAEVIAAHSGTAWRVGFSGFAPGFAYLIDGDPRLQVPRRAEPRTAVPAGSVALAGEFSAVYPRTSPGGWQVIGHTDAVLWDLDRPTPALLLSGMRVTFRPTRNTRR